MKNYKLLLYTIIILLLSNVPPLNFIFKLLSGDSIVPGMSENFYVTKDLNYIYEGSLGDTLKNPCYRKYKEISTKSSHTLYRLQKIEPWRFWRWGEYITEEKWRQPYISVSEKELKQALLSFSNIYQPANGTLSCSQFPKSSE
jgi:hypothetical protein